MEVSPPWGGAGTAPQPKEEELPLTGTPAIDSNCVLLAATEIQNEMGIRYCSSERII